MGMEDPTGPMDVNHEPVINVEEFVAVASDFGGTPGTPSDEAAHHFVQHFPLQAVFRLLLDSGDIPEVVSSACSALDRLFKSGWGRSLLPRLMEPAVAGLRSASPRVRLLSCSQVARLLDDIAGGVSCEEAVEAVERGGVVRPLLDTLEDSDEGVAAMALTALQNLATTQEGMRLLLSEASSDTGKLGQLATSSSSVVRFRAVDLASFIAGQSPEASTAVAQLGLLRPLLAEVENATDVLASMNALEIMGELAATVHGSSFVLHTDLPQRLIALIRSPSTHSLLRSRAMTVAGRLLSPHDSIHSPISTQDATALVHVVSGVLERAAAAAGDTEGHSADANGFTAVDPAEEEAALDALGLMGTSTGNAELLLQPPRPAARHVTKAAFDSRRHANQLVALHSLASLLGAERLHPSPLLAPEAEEKLRELVYGAAAATRSHTPGAVLWQLLQQAEETRMAVYRLLTALVARHWGVTQVCSHPGMVAFLADPRSERRKTAMEWRHSVCAAIVSAAQAMVGGGEMTVFPEVIDKLDAAVRCGPYLSQERFEAIPIVTTDDRPPQPPPPPPPPVR